MAQRTPNRNQPNANRRPQGQGNGRPRPSGSEAERRRAAQAARERRRKQNRNIRIVTILTLVVLIAIIVVVIVSCSNRKNAAPAGSSQTAAQPTGEQNGGTGDNGETSNTADKNAIPSEYVAATVEHDEIEVTDKDPVQGTDTDCKIVVNTALNVTTFYDADGKAVKAFACSTGRRDGHETPEGTFSLGEWIIKPSNEWCYMADGTEGLYAYRIIDNINNDIMFHSVPYLETDHGTIEYEEYNKLGDYASMGCIRMACADVRWLGEHCGTGTTVEIHYDENESLPIPKPDPIRIPEELEQVRGWDPTDPDSANPWHKYTIDLQVPNSVNVAKGTDAAQDPVLAAATAKDNYENDLSNYLKVEGSYDSDTAGTYKVQVRCDVGPVHAYKDVYVIVE